MIVQAWNKWNALAGALLIGRTFLFGCRRHDRRRRRRIGTIVITTGYTKEGSRAQWALAYRVAVEQWLAPLGRESLSSSHSTNNNNQDRLGAN